MAETSVKSFVENVNALANATTLATGDIVEDTQEARDAAIAAAEAASISETNSAASEGMSQKWAENGHNNPVKGTIGVDAEYSSYHWSVVTSLQIGDPLINDNITSGAYTWSSNKINDELTNKAALVHEHSGVYEPVITPKGTAFNKNFSTSSGNNGSATTVAREDHLHANYEPVRTTQGTAYNKDFGTTSGTVSEGDHTHAYEPAFTKNTAFNKSFVANALAPLADEVPRGNHVHAASGVTYDNAGTNILSGTAQGAITELDAAVSIITVSEKTKLNAGMTDPSYTVTNAGADQPNIINAGMTVGANSKNAIYNNGVQINYATAPEKLIEGRYTAIISIFAESNTRYALGLALNGTVIDSSIRSETGSDVNGTVGTFSVSISIWVSAFSNLDIAQAVVYSSSANNIVIESMVVSWDGQPEGALVASGATVAHADTTGRDAIQQHPTSSIYETGNIGVSLDDVLLKKADKVVAPITDNLLAMDANGNLKDSGISTTTASNHMNLVATPTLDNIVIMDSAGESKDGGLGISALALKNGNSLEVFEIANSTLDTQAVSQGQMNGLAATYTTQVDFDSHTAATNPHSVSYTDTGAAASIHTHVIADTTGLQDALDGKYLKVVTPVTNNVAIYGAGDVLLDSGQNLLSTLLTGEPA